MTVKATHDFCVLGHNIRITGPADLVDPIAYAYRRFATSSEDRPDTVTISVTDARVSVEGVVLPTPILGHEGKQLYQEFVQQTMDRVSEYAVLHGACVVNDQGACLLAAPSGHGKSSLALALAASGYRLTGDDYAPLDMAKGVVLPFPRAIAFYPEGKAAVPEAIVRRARSSKHSLFGKQIADIGELLGEDTVVKQPVPLRTVVLLNDRNATDQPISVDIGYYGRDALRFEKDLLGVDGIEITDSVVTATAGQWTLGLDHRRYPTAALNALLDRPQVRSEKRVTTRPSFAGDPRLTAIPRRVAADALCQEILNRRGSGALLKRYNGSLARLFLDVAGALRDVRCYQLEVGDFGQTVSTIQTVLRG
ncbi:MAG: hypothetical protein OEV00_02310 [Acidobacteriota bacterium]|nr:hypothetical protein [Acidobacteriota bacterium]MDH3784142.1 hypothetical protein [Acidobacteriota bacterium]